MREIEPKPRSALSAGGNDLLDPELTVESLFDRCVRLEISDRSIAMRGVAGAPDWLVFEMKIWELGEQLRTSVKKYASVRARAGVIVEAATQILGEKKFGKGRQAFALLLGDIGGISCANALGTALRDTDVRGHALKSLLKLKIAGFEQEAKQILEEDAGWVRSSAKRYLMQSGAFVVRRG